MGTFISGLFALFTIAPLLLYVLVFLIAIFMNGDSKKSLQLAADISTFFLIFSVHYLIITIWNKSLFGFIFLFLLLLLGLFTYLYKNIKGHFNYLLILKGFWRMSFLIFLILYIFLMVYGLISSAFTNLFAFYSISNVFYL